MKATRTTASALVAAGLMFTAACGSDGGTQEQGRSISVENCGGTVELPGPPQRVTLLKSASVSTLAGLGVLDRVTARAGVYPREYFSPETNRTLDGIRSVTDKVDASGHLQISREEVVATDPDLVVGATDTVNRQTLQSSNIPLVEEPAFCDAIDGPVTWDNVWDQVRLYGKVFDRGDRANEFVDQLKARLAEVEKEQPARKPDGRPYRVAVLYPTVGGGVTYAYGNRSMAAPVVESAGAENVYGSTDDRVFEVSGEDLVDRNPDAVIALYSDGDSRAVTDAVKKLPGFDRTEAGKAGNVMPLMLNFAEPPTPLAVDGLQKVDDYLHGLGR